MRERIRHSIIRKPPVIQAIGLFTAGAMVCLLFTAISPLLSASVSYPAGEISASLEPERARIGDVVLLTLHYRLPEGASLQTPVNVLGTEGLTTLEQSVDATQIQIKLFVDRPENWKSGPLSVTFRDKNGARHTLTASGVSLTVDGVLPENSADARLRPIRDIVATTGFWWTHRYWIAGIVVLFLLSACTFLWSKRRRKGFAPEKIDEPAHITARNAIEALERRRIFENGDVKTFYFIFSKIMRRYLESSRQFPAMEYTTEEIARRVKTDEDQKLLMLLKQADLIKFADAVPTRDRKQEDIRWALSYIRETSSTLNDNDAEGSSHSAVDGSL